MTILSPNVLRRISTISSKTSKTSSSSFSLSLCYRRNITSTPKTSTSSITSTLFPSNESSKPYYITSPIFYVNAAPHVGHLYSMLIADILKRWKQLTGEKALLSIGTDEHGLKIQQAAKKAEMDTQAFCDAGVELFKDLAQQGDISYDYFARTTDFHHKNAVQYAWTQLHEKGYIYEAKHKGWYSISDETFYSESKTQLGMDPVTGKKRRESTETGSVVEWTEETNYKFRLSSFEEPLLKFYQENPNWITPLNYMHYVVNDVKSGLTDLSISRPKDRVQWGIPVPGDPSQNVYVWLDALLNYPVQLGYPNGDYITGGWPADVHVIGKDILRFHCIHWPAFLMALELPLPKRILSHAHWTMSKQKMSKSRGNVVNPFYILDAYGPDVFRWYLISEGGLSSDSDFDREELLAKYKILSGGIGNLLTRVTRSKKWNVPEAIRSTWKSENAVESLRSNLSHTEMIETLLKLRYRVEKHMGNLNSKHALREILQVVHVANKWFHDCEPWNHTDSNFKGDISNRDTSSMNLHLSTCIGLAVEVLRICGIALIPFMPNKASELLDMLGVDSENRTWDHAQVGHDVTYGLPHKDYGSKHEGLLFPHKVGFVIPLGNRSLRTAAVS